MKWLKACALTGARMLAGRSRILVLTHHKCASIFVQEYLERICRMNDLRMFHSYEGMAQPRPECDISFLMNAEYPLIERALSVPAVHIIRNPLDIVQSAYYSHRSQHRVQGWPQLVLQRDLLANVTKEEGFYLTTAFLEREDMSPRTPGPLHALRFWSFDDTRIVTVRMEDLVADVNQVLGRHVVSGLGRNTQLPPSEDYTFERMSGGRRVGEVDEKSHYRSGRAGAWRDELPGALIAYVRTNFRTVLERYYPESLA